MFPLGNILGSRFNKVLLPLVSNFCRCFQLVPNTLANYSLFSLNFHFRLFYLNAKVHLISIANWASSVAIWWVTN